MVSWFLSALSLASFSWYAINMFFHVVFAALASDLVVLLVLITFIHTHRVLVVQHYWQRTLYRGNSLMA